MNWASVLSHMKQKPYLKSVSILRRRYHVVYMIVNSLQKELGCHMHLVCVCVSGFVIMFLTL